MATSGNEALITEAFVQRLAALVLTPTLLVAYPNVAFPATGQAKPATYLQASILRAETRPIGISRWDERAGIFQVDVVSSAQSGLVPPTEIADAVADWFPRFTRLVNDGVQVDVYETPAIGPLVVDAAPYYR